MLSLSSATRPASTCTERVRSPLVPRWPLRRWRAPGCSGSREQVHVAGQVLPRSAARHVRLPPRRPSTPTSRGHRGHLIANVAACCLLLMVSARPPPRPWRRREIWFQVAVATAVTTSRSAHCSVKIGRITLPYGRPSTAATPGTCAWPPASPRCRLRGPPRDFAGKPFQLIPMVLMVFLSSRISPFTSTVYLAPTDRRAPRPGHLPALLRTWGGRFAARKIDLSSGPSQVRRPGNHGLAATPSCHSRPRASLRRSKERSWSTMVFRFLQQQISPALPPYLARQVAGADRGRDFAMLRTWR